MFERFSNQARAVVFGARSEAEGLHHRYVGTEHLLLALLDEGSGVAYRVLTAAGVGRQRVRADIERLVGTGRATFDDGDIEALQSIGIDLPAVQARLEELFGPGALDPPAPVPRRGLLRRRRSATVPAPGGPPRFTPRAKKVLELSLREAIRLKHNYLGPEHLLLGLLREGEGLAAQILTDAGLTIEDLRRRTLAALDEAA
jgi:ATP-dependent Clp protease ATP-binding subunit ClpA